MIRGRTSGKKSRCFDPVYAGGLENAALQETMRRLVFAINQGAIGAFFYRMARPDQF